MTTKRVTMHKIKEVLRLKYSAELPIRQIAQSLRLSAGVGSKYLTQAQAAGLDSFRLQVIRMVASSAALSWWRGE